MAAVGMDRKRVFEFMDEEVAKEAARNQPKPKIGGAKVELSFGNGGGGGNDRGNDGGNDSVDEGGSSCSNASKIESWTPRRKSRELQQETSAIRKANAAKDTEIILSLETKDEADSDVLGMDPVQVYASIRPTWPSEAQLAGTPNDRGHAQFECLTTRMGKSGKSMVQLHMDYSQTLSGKWLKGKGKKRKERLLQTESGIVDRVFIPDPNGEIGIAKVLIPEIAASSSPAISSSSLTRTVTQRVEGTDRNLAVLLHGQTGSGKTYTALCLHREIAKSLLSKSGEILVSYYELQAGAGSGRVVDLLATTADESAVKICINPLTQRHYVPARKESCTTIQKVIDVLQKGENKRSSRQTTVHEASSRSHAFCCLSVYSRKVSSTQGHSEELRTVTIIDLAGSERSKETFANRGKAMEETRFICTSLNALQECIRSLKQKANYIPFRKSTLTLLLRDLAFSNQCSNVLPSNVLPQSSKILLGEKSDAEIEKSEATGTQDAPPTQIQNNSNSKTEVIWIGHFSPMSWDAAHSRNTITFFKSLNGLTNSTSLSDPSTWTKVQVSNWLAKIEGGRFAKLKLHMDGKTLKNEWRNDFVKKVELMEGGANEDGERIYDLFRQELQNYSDSLSGKKKVC